MIEARLLRLLIAGLSATMAALTFENQAPDTAREADVYRIYSQMMTSPRTSHGPDTNARYLIAETTRWGPQPLCVKPPTDREADFNEVLDDFAIRKANPKVLQRLLRLAKPYELLNSEQVGAFQKSRGLPPKPGDPKPLAIFEGVTDVFTLSDVYFSKNGKLAMTGVSTWCGGDCGLDQWKVYEKLQSGEWKERPWTTCIGFASLPSVLPETVPAPDGLRRPTSLGANGR
jgi:hypothetical protein